MTRGLSKNPLLPCFSGIVGRRSRSSIFSVSARNRAGRDLRGKASGILVDGHIMSTSRGRSSNSIRKIGNHPDLDIFNHKESSLILSETGNQICYSSPCYAATRADEGAREVVPGFEARDDAGGRYRILVVWYLQCHPSDHIWRGQASSQSSLGIHPHSVGQCHGPRLDWDLGR
jgi:hypothetical protein